MAQEPRGRRPLLPSTFLHRCSSFEALLVLRFLCSQRLRISREAAHACSGMIQAPGVEARSLDGRMEGVIPHHLESPGRVLSCCLHSSFT